MLRGSASPRGSMPINALHVVQVLQKPPKNARTAGSSWAVPYREA